MKYMSRKAAVENVRQAFSQTEEDALTIQEIARAWGSREDVSEEANVRWLGNKMTHWKYHGLVQPVYKRRNSRRVLDKIQLTLEGKKELGRIGQDGGDSVMSSNISLESIMSHLPELRKNNPDYDITFDIRLKENVEK